MARPAGAGRSLQPKPLIQLGLGPKSGAATTGTSPTLAEIAFKKSPMGTPAVTIAKEVKTSASPSADSNIPSKATPTASIAIPTPPLSQSASPLLSSPSSFALFLATPTTTPPPPSLVSTVIAIRPTSVELPPNITPFTFSDPSRDDVVAAARAGKGLPAHSKDGGPTSSKLSSATSKKPLISQKNNSSNNLLSDDLAAMGLPQPRPSPGGASTPPDTAPTAALNPLQPSTASLIPPPAKSYRRIDVPKELAKKTTETGHKDHLSVVVVGHVDAGKSTLMGHVLVLTGEVDSKTFQKNSRESAQAGKSSFAFAWVLDEDSVERARGVTTDVAVRGFETEKRRFTLLDAPGHKDFVPKMLGGAAQADVAVLVVDGIRGEFESGFQQGGQTREHVLLVRSLGVSQILVCVNKMDAEAWSKSRYDQIVKELEPFLLQAGFLKSRISFVPCSGFTGENIQTRSDPTLSSWYSGPTFLEFLDQFQVPPRPVDRPFRLSVVDAFKSSFGSSVVVTGKVLSGHVQIGQAVLAMPNGEGATIKSIQVSDDNVDWAAAGDNVVLSLAGIELNQIGIGHVLCDPVKPVSIASTFLTQIVVFDTPIPITAGFRSILHHQSTSEQVTVSKLVSVIDKATGEATSKKPRRIPRNATATVELKVDRALCVEAFKDSKDLGRFTLRHEGVTIAAGIIIQVIS
ncbi:HBS1-like protein [Gonapodya sp. JEL0774]|nr:HBS1-like protein [Gonapodya sp. JEL0774]